MSSGVRTDFVKMGVLYESERAMHKHKDIEILYMMAGEMKLAVDTELRTMKREDVVLINPYVMHGMFMDDGSREKTLCAWIRISTDYVQELTGTSDVRFFCSTLEEQDNVNYANLREVLRYIVKDYAGSGNQQQLIQYSNYFRLLHILVNFFRVSSLSFDDTEEGRAEKLKQYIGQNYASDLSLSDLADYMNMSTSYVSRWFRKQMNVNFVDYLYELRLSKAEEQLIWTDDNITEISYNTGFPNIATFNRLFRKKYECTPSEYRAENRMRDMPDTPVRGNVPAEAMNALQDYFGMAGKNLRKTKTDEELAVTADIAVYREYNPIWNKAINLGPAETLLNSDMQLSVNYAKQHLGFYYGRFWSIFSPGMYIVGAGSRGTNRFHRLDRILNFLIKNEVIPIIELGEKQDEIRLTAGEALREDSRTTLFRNYGEFLQTLDEMMRHLVSLYTVQQVNTWIFELWDDRRVEPYADKQNYIRLFSDVRGIIKRYAPKATIGGAGNYLGWNPKHTEACIRQWVDSGVIPDQLTFTYAPYASGEIESARLSKRKADEDDLAHSLDEVHAVMKKYGFPDRLTYISSWNMTASSRNYFNDSLWKGCYVVKCFIDNLGKVDGLLYAQLQDSETDYFDNQQLLNGSGGLLTRDLIEKPAFTAMRLMRHLQKYLVAKGENYIITRDEYGTVTILMHNFIERNYMYFVQEEDENTLQNHYTYFKNQHSKKLSFRLSGMLADTTYGLHHHIMNRKYGSIMDEWAELGFQDTLHLEDIEYLKTVTRPHLSFTTETADRDGVLSFDADLEPLEVRCISIRPER